MQRLETKVYKLRYNNKTTLCTSKIAEIVQKKYNLHQSKESICRWISKNFQPINRHTSVYTDFEIRLLCRWWTSFQNKELVIRYFNKKYCKNLTDSSLSTMMSRRSLKAMRDGTHTMVSKKDEYDIIAAYKKGATTIDLAQKYGFKRPKSIADILKHHAIKLRHGADARKVKVPYRDFDMSTIDTDFKAYLLGLLLTDGYVVGHQVGIQLKDKDCVDFIAGVLGTMVLKTKPIPAGTKGRKYKKSALYRTVMNGEKIKQACAKFGIVKRKSKTLRLKNLRCIHKKLYPMILRGIIDGDGWIRKDGKEFFICSASQEFIRQCETMLNSIGIANMNLSQNAEGVYYLRSARQENIAILRTLVYKEPYGMMRKYDRVHSGDVQRL